MTTILASTRADLLRLRAWPAAWVVGIAWLFLLTLFNYVFTYVAYRTGSDSFATDGAAGDALLSQVLPAAVPEAIVTGTPMFGGALLLVLGAMAASSGFGWGSWKTIFTQGPTRSAVTVGALLSLAGVVAVIVLASVVLAGGISTGLALVEGVDVVLPGLGETVTAAATAFLVLLMWALLGYLLGTLARGPALAVGLGLVWAMVVENLLRGVGALLGWVEAAASVLPGTASGSLVGSVTGVGAGSAPGVLDTLDGQRALVTVLAYLLLAPLVTLFVVNRRDLT